MLSFYFNESEVTPASVEIHTLLYLYTIILMANFVHSTSEILWLMVTTAFLFVVINDQ